MPGQNTKNVFLTGAAGGIGAETARQLAERGHAVFAGIHESAGALAGSSRVHPVPIDVTDPAAVAAAAELVRREVGDDGLQAVVNNAGVIVQGPLELVPDDELRRQFEINTLGPVRVIQSFLPLLRSGHGRVVNVSAPTARVPVPMMGPIGASKAALVSLSESLRVELAAWGIPVVLVEPGGTETEIFAKAGAAAEASLAAADPARAALYRNHIEAFAKAAGEQKLGPVEPVAGTIVKAVESARPRRWYGVGSGTRLFSTLSRLPGGTRDRLVASAFGLRGVETPG
ncbi:MAG TPA: SDR family NAD(P)-dependent oxidoreductase [Solirubrobacterales bacterium]|jgi:NAD(P)-dependent dehydrogenase (short-subunit alcohol dehydrogenase family)